ncbi:hypothetical protein OT109_01440 [Phycisphaeraceae bacterium D3-23]
MTYTEILIAASRPDAPASSVADLFTMAQAEAITPADAVADRRALQAVFAAPAAADIDAADKADADAAEVVRAARAAADAATRKLEDAEAAYVAAHKTSTEMHHRDADAGRAMQRPAVAAAIKIMETAK